MKKEVFAISLLIVMISAAFFNIHHLEKITGEVIETVERMVEYVDSGDWEQAAVKAGDAIAQWEGHATYTHIVLRHAEINAVTSVLYDLLKEAYAQNDGESRAAAQAAVYQLSDIARMEKVSAGSIF